MIISGSLQSASAAACKHNPWFKMYSFRQNKFYFGFDLEEIMSKMGTFYMSE